MTEVFGNCLNIVAVIDKQAGVTVSESVNALSAWKSEKWNHLWWWSPSRAWMKSSHSSDEVRGQASDRIKSATRRSRISSRSDFIHLWWIYSAAGRFHCTSVLPEIIKNAQHKLSIFVFDCVQIISSRTVRTAAKTQKQLSVVFSPNGRGLSSDNRCSSGVSQKFSYSKAENKTKALHRAELLKKCFWLISSSFGNAVWYRE